MSSTLAYRPDIDGLRAIAVLPVILFHAGFDWFSGGYVGVDVFFVISGYLITNILLREIRSGTFSLVHFYERRARRILPALFLVCLASLPVAWWLLPPQALTDFAQSLIATATFWSNILFWLESDYFAATAELKPLLHTWSLAIEEQFYLFFPLILLLLAKWQLSRINLLILLFAVISYGLMLWGLPRYPEATFYLLPTRAWELMAGALLAVWHTRRIEANHTPIPAATATNMLSLSGLLLIATAVFFLDHDTPFPSHWTLLPVIGTALIIGFSQPGHWVHRLLRQRPLVLIGLFSYSAYLWHQPMFAFAKIYYISVPPPAVMVLLVMLSLLLAYLSWRYIEFPFRSRSRVSRQTVFVCSGVASTAIIAIGLSGYLNQGFPILRSTPQLIESLKTARPSPMREQCHTQGNDYLKPKNSCTYGGDNITWAVFGDSHAVEPAYALAQELKQINKGIKHYSFSLCGPNYGLNDSVELEIPNGCSDWTKEAIEDIKLTASINNVLVVFRLNYYLYGPHENTYPELPQQTTKHQREQVWQGLVNTLAALVDQGKEVMLMLQAPEPPTHIGNLLFASQENLSLVKGVPFYWWSMRNGYVWAKISELPTSIKIIDPSDILCDKVYCYVTDQDGNARYFDDDHLSVKGAIWSLRLRPKFLLSVQQ